MYLITTQITKKRQQWPKNNQIAVSEPKTLLGRRCQGVGGRRLVQQCSLDFLGKNVLPDISSDLETQPLKVGSLCYDTKPRINWLGTAWIIGTTEEVKKIFI